MDDTVGPDLGAASESRACFGRGDGARTNEDDIPYIQFLCIRGNTALPQGNARQLAARRGARLVRRKTLPIFCAVC